MSNLFPITPEPPPVTREDVIRVARIARALIEAALRNRSIREQLRDLSAWPLLTIAQVRANPPVKVEFEHAFVVAPLGDCLSAAKGKRSFGQLLSVLPVDPEDEVDRLRVLYYYKESSPYNRRVEQRKWLKKQLGKGARKLVCLAMRECKRDFLTEMDHEKRGFPGGRDRIVQVLGMTPERFWRVARGKEMIEIPKQPVQLWLPFQEE